MQAISKILPKASPENGKYEQQEGGVFSSVDICPCGGSGRFHVCREELKVCGACGGIGRYINPGVPFGHPDYYVSCDCAPEKRRGNQYLDRVKTVRRLNEISHNGHKKQTFENFKPNWDSNARGNLYQALHIVQGFARAPRWWSLTLVGKYGCGKTHLGRATQHYCNEKANGAVFVVVPDLLDAIRSTFDDDSEISYSLFLRQVRNAPFLILDDMGSEYGTHWVNEKMFQIINYRYNKQYPTLVLTNLPLDRLEGRVESRLSEGKIFKILAGDYRKNKKQ